jgi:hypothetical protein
LPLGQIRPSIPPPHWPPRRFRIKTLEERHAGPYPGRHARYVLRGVVEIVSIGDKGMAA